MDKREQVGVSEVFGYILVFVMVSFLLSVIYLQAMPQLKSQEDYANFKVMEDNLMVLRDYIGLVAFNVTPSKVVSLNVNKGVVYLTPIATVNISTKTKNYNYTISGLAYEIGNSRIYILCGAVVECFGNSCIVISDPPFTKDCIRLINLSGYLAFSGPHSLTLTNANVTVLKVDWINFTFEDTALAQAWNDSLSKIGLNAHLENNEKSVNVTFNGLLTYHEVNVS